jgi:hypothetical protein
VERTNRGPAATAEPEEQFWLTEPATGKRRFVREMADPEIARHMQQQKVKMLNAMHSYNEALRVLMQTSSTHAVLEYEISRRKHVLANPANQDNPAA